MTEDPPEDGGLIGSPGTSGGESRSNPSGRNPYEIFLEIADLIARDNSSQDVLHDLAPLLQELTGCDFVKLSLHDPAQDCMLAHFWKASKETGDLPAQAVSECASGWVWQHQQGLTIPDLENDPRFPVCLSTLRKHNVRSFASLPMSTVQHHYGALGMGKSEREPADIHNSQFLSRIAQMIALALENHDIRRDLREQQERIKSLVAISGELSASLDLERLPPIIFSNLRRITSYDYAVLALLEADNRSLRIDALDLPSQSCVAGFGRPDLSAGRIHFRRSHCYSQRQILKRRRSRSPGEHDRQQDPRRGRSIHLLCSFVLG